MKNKPILCLDFDGVIHSYTSGWKGARKIPDPPVKGAMTFLSEAVKMFEVHIFSSRSHQWGGKNAMKRWIYKELKKYYGTHQMHADDVFCELQFPKHKPPASVLIDDRAITFNGKFPKLNFLLQFQPWNRSFPQTYMDDISLDIDNSHKAME